MENGQEGLPEDSAAPPSPSSNLVGSHSLRSVPEPDSETRNPLRHGTMASSQAVLASHTLSRVSPLDAGTIRKDEGTYSSNVTHDSSAGPEQVLPVDQADPAHTDFSANVELAGIQSFRPIEQPPNGKTPRARRHGSANQIDHMKSQDGEIASQAPFQAPEVSSSHHPAEAGLAQDQTAMLSSPPEAFNGDVMEAEEEGSASESFARIAPSTRFDHGEMDNTISFSRGVGAEADDPSAFLTGVNRSTTFPDVRSNTSPQSTSLPAAKLLQEPDEIYSTRSEEALDNFEGHVSKHVVGGKASHQKSPIDSIHVSPEQDPVGAEAFENRFAPQANGGYPPTDEETRYDEGLPLIRDQTNQPEHTSQQQLPTEGYIGLVHKLGFNDYFDESAPSAKNSQVSVPSFGLERKSTSQVIGSLHLSSSKVGEEVPAHSVSDKNASISAALHRLQDAGEPYILTNKGNPKDRVLYPVDSGGHEDQNLTAMWKAALDDEEFLEDVEAMPDTLQYFEEKDQVPLQSRAWDFTLAEGNEDFNSSMPIENQSTGVGTANNPNMGYPQVDSTPALGPRAYSESMAQQYPPMSTPSLGPQSQDMDIAGLNQARSITSRGASQNPNHAPSPYSSTFPNSTNIERGPHAGDFWQQQRQQRPEMVKAQSYADKSKGGYSSPYDLPMDISKPRKRPNAYRTATRGTAPIPAQVGQLPPRSTSMYANQFSAAISQPVRHLPAVRSASSLPVSQQSRKDVQQPATNGGMPSASSTRPAMNPAKFFEDLPITAKGRHPNTSGRYTPQSSSIANSHPAPSAARQAGQHFSHLPGDQFISLPQQPSGPPMAITAEQLRAPERFDPFHGGPQPSPVPSQSYTHKSRYSPAPPSHPTIKDRPKYAPIPSVTPSGSGLPHQPRTSSPLTYPPRSSFENPQQTSTSTIQGYASYGSQPQMAGPPTTEEPIVPRYNYQARISEGDEEELGTERLRPNSEHKSLFDPNAPSSIGPSSPLKQPASNLQLKELPYSPFNTALIDPPRRSQTQSPGTALAGQSTTTASREPYQRPASVNVPTSPKSTSTNYAGFTRFPPNARPRGFSRPLNYIAPTDGRETDPLCRWRGCPIISWGFGGRVVITFPKEVQRYSSGQQYPSIKCSPGEVKTHSTNAIIPIEDYVGRFPGPLRGKGKKKDVLAWLKARIEQSTGGGPNGYSTFPENAEKHEERVLLFRVLSIFIENDGLLVGNEAAQKAVNEVLVSHLQFSRGALQSSLISGVQTEDRMMTSGVSPAGIQSADPDTVHGIKEALLAGDREGAIWKAVDKRLWGHALLISSTVSRDFWKQVIQEFVGQEIRPLGGSAKSLSALYEIFGGNFEESIDELVPPSARAGFQLVSKSTEPMSTDSAAQGLGQWVETLLLVLRNRTTDDGQAIAALGRLLLGYGRVEAAHVCFMFARPYASFSGFDDPQTSIALVGANQAQITSSLTDHIESVLLSEIYEFGISLTPSSSNTSAPHLQIYKLCHAFLLAEHGYRNEAQQYCDAIAQNIKTSAKPSGYYHGLLISFLDDFSGRLQQSPKDGSSSWISKPSMEKVSGSLFAKFNSFVAGNEKDHVSANPEVDGGSGDIGPFARVSGNTPTISSPPPQEVLDSTLRPSNAYPAGVRRGSLGATVRYSSYTSGAAYVPQASLDQSHPNFEATNIPGRLHRAFTESAKELKSSYEPPKYLGIQNPSLDQSFYPPANPEESYAARESSGQQNVYLPSLRKAPSAAYAPLGHINSSSTLDQTASWSDRKEVPGPYQGMQQDLNPQISLPAESPYGSTTLGYQPSSYEPPTYDNPYEQTLSESQRQNVADEGFQTSRDMKRPSSTASDEDDDITARAAELARRERARKDQEAEENFKKAAAADAKLDSQQGDKKGWFGGWFGKKDQNAPSGPIKAKLGEKGSFYYDTELKKWVNKKGGTPQASSGSTPPPPKGPPSRSASRGVAEPPVVSGVSAPAPAGPYIPGLAAPPLHKTPSSSRLTPPIPSSGGDTPARAISPAVGTSSGDPAIMSENPGESAVSAGPPSRPTTSMGTASSIDDLLGPAGTARKGGTIKKAKKGRGYVDVMAKS